jgi:hypothetical protein
VTLASIFTISPRRQTNSPSLSPANHWTTISATGYCRLALSDSSKLWAEDVSSILHNILDGTDFFSPCTLLRRFSLPFVFVHPLLGKAIGLGRFLSGDVFGYVTLLYPGDQRICDGVGRVALMLLADVTDRLFETVPFAIRHTAPGSKRV